MAWYTSFWRKYQVDGAYHTKEEVKKEVEKISERINSIRTSLNGLVMMTEPRKFIDFGDQDPTEVLTKKFESLMSELEKLVRERHILCQLSAAFEEGTDYGKKPINDFPDPAYEDNMYMYGDYIYSVKRPKGVASDF